MTQNQSLQDLSLCLRSFNPETEIDFLELSLFKLIYNELNFQDILEMIYEYFMRICLILMENSYREILYLYFKSKRYDYITFEIESKTDEELISFNSVTSESSGQLKSSLCTPFQHQVSFSSSSTLHRYTRSHEFSAINLLTIDLSRRKSRDSLYIFGKDTTSFYRWDHNPSYQMIKDFLLEKK